MWIINLARKLYNLGLNLLFPINCLGCGKEGFLICPDCLVKIPLYDKFICPACQRPSLYGKSCPTCRSHLKGIVIALDYHEPIIKKTIQSFKYQPYIFGLAQYFAHLIIKCLKQSPYHFNYFRENNFILIPIPLAKRKLAERGFNQTELIAEVIAKELDWPLETKILFKIKETLSQTNFSKEERKNNVKNTFLVKDTTWIKNKNILLVDDIFTTGATLEEAAKILRQAGAKEVWGIVLAKG